MTETRDKLQYFIRRMEEELERTIHFWQRNSLDTKHGGYYTCLTQDGKVYDTTKYGWMVARQDLTGSNNVVIGRVVAIIVDQLRKQSKILLCEQRRADHAKVVWIFSKLYNETNKFHTDQMLQAAILGGDFLVKHIKRAEDCRCYFSLTADGRPVKLQRKLFTECFYAIAMSELFKATGQLNYMAEATEMLQYLIHWARVDDSALGQQKFSGVAPSSSLAVPMMLLFVIREVSQADNTNQQLRKKHLPDKEWAVEQILQHSQRNGTAILETVSTRGKELPGSDGRLMNPGHAIEAGWFLIQHACETGNQDLLKTAIDNFIMRPFETGWDSKYGGLYYFLDVEGFSPTQLEWNMKLYWPHNEAMIAFLMAYRETGNEIFFEKFQLVFDYSFSHFVDSDYGEWFGYLSRQGEVTHSFKGGPYKGCFHLPRSLHMCIKILKELQKKCST